MPGRVQPENPCWVLCCCGGIPIIGAIKGLVYSPPAIVYGVIATTTIAVLCLPHDAYLVLKVLWTTSQLGPNLRILLLLMFPIIMCAWPVLILLFGFLGFFLYCFCTIGVSVFDDDKPLFWGGITSVYRETHKAVKQFWEFNSTAVFSFAQTHSYIPHGWDGEVFEIPLTKVIVGLILTVHGTLVGATFGSAIVVFKYIPCLLRANKDYLAAGNVEIHWVPFFIIGWAMMNALSPIIAAICFTYTCMAGIQSALHALKSNILVSGFWEAYRLMREFDILSSTYAFQNEFTCIPKIPEQAVDRSIANDGGHRQDSVLENVYSRYLTRCCEVAKDTMLRNEITRNNILDAEPFVILGIPAVALFTILLEDESYIGSNTTVSCGGANFSRDDLGNNGIVNVFFPKVISIRRAIYRLQLSEKDTQFIKFALLAGSCPDEDMTNAARELKVTFDQDTELKKPKLNGLVSDLNAFAIDVSRLNFMVTNFQKRVLISSTTENPGDDVC